MVIQQNKKAYFAVKYTKGQAHCAFTWVQLSSSFNALRKGVHSGIKPILIEKISN